MRRHRTLWTAVAAIMLALAPPSAIARNPSPDPVVSSAVAASREQARRAEALKAIQRQRVGNRRLAKLSALKVPGAAQASVSHTWPTEYERGNSAAGALNGTIYDPDRILDKDGRGHEMFHLLDQQHLTVADRARLQRRLGVKRGVWDHDGPSAPSEIAADWYAALVNKRDPKRSWSAGYDGAIPTRKALLRFGRELERIGKRYKLATYRDPV